MSNDLLGLTKAEEEMSLLRYVLRPSSQVSVHVTPEDLEFSSTSKGHLGLRLRGCDILGLCTIGGV